MFAIAIAIINGCIVSVLCLKLADLSPVWAITWGVCTILVSHILIALLVRRKINGINRELQASMMAGQEKVNRTVQQLQMKPRGNMKTMQKLLEKEQAVYLKSALQIVEKMEAYTNWSPLLSKQINSMRLQFYFQLKEFDKVDAVIPHAIYMDATLVAMRLTRMYHNKDAKLDDFYKKKIKKFSGDNAVLLYALYSWILVKRDEVDKAIKVLVEGKDATDNETLKNNWDFLVNGKIKRFSNAALGETWYSLYLEEPKMQKQQRRVKQVYR